MDEELNDDLLKVPYKTENGLRRAKMVRGMVRENS